MRTIQIGEVSICLEELGQGPPFEEVGAPLARLLSAPLVGIPGGHFTPLDCPEELTAALQAFITSLAA